jgi:hypothetical protein
MDAGYLKNTQPFRWLDASCDGRTLSLLAAVMLSKMSIE